MAGLKLNTLYEANAYLNGNNCLGQLQEFTVPGIKPKMVDHTGLGIQGAVEMPAGFEKMEFKGKWNSVYEDVLAQFSDIYIQQQIIIFGNVQQWDGNNLTAEVPATVTITGKSKGTPDITVKQQDNPEIEKMMSVTAVKFEVGGRVIYHLDIINQIYIVDGVDKWAQRRENLGI